MIARTTVKTVLREVGSISSVTVYGWIITARKGKNVAFASITDGSTPERLQVVFDRSVFSEEDLSGLSTGACIRVEGGIQESPGDEQSRELHATALEVIGPSEGDYPLQKKRHSLEFLRSIPHLRPRTNTFGAAFRMSHHLSLAIHRFFDENDFFYIHAPVITSSDAEGAGEAFRVTSLPTNAYDRRIDQKEYFGREAYLTVSAQLEAEPLALALGNVYTFGPTFRADPSDTRFHAAEFWMIEPEMAFCDLEDDMNIIERFLGYTASELRRKCSIDIQFFRKFYESGLDSRYELLEAGGFKRISYTDVLQELTRNANEFQVAPVWGMDISTEYERFVTERLFGKPAAVFVTDYPETLKPFYARLNDDGRTVAAADLLLPEVGEIVGASQREERLDVLTRRTVASGAAMEDYEWYLDLRRWGSAPHSGFGLGFERLLMYLTGIENIRDVIPFPRTMGRMI